MGTTNVNLRTVPRIRAAVSATVDVAQLADGAGATYSVSVPGAQLGDFVLVASPVDLLDVTVTAYVQSANTVEVRVQNESGATLTNPDAATWNFLVIDGKSGQ